ncbi:MAG: LbtU family siderophore porin [Chlorobiales bacterium]|nr:LbtU family siderophore porin [Chlorobiales bacterium]
MNESFRYEIGGSWKNNIGDTEGLQEDFQATNYVTTDFVSGYSFYGIASLGSFDVRGEYLATATQFKDGARAGMKPAAWNIEMGYAMEIPVRFALRYAGANEFDIRQQYGATVGYDFAVGTSLALEYLHHEHDDHTQGDGLTVQIAMKF